MPNVDIDFEGTGTQGTTTPPAQTTANNDGNVANQDDVTNLNGNDVDDVTGKDGNATTQEPKDGSDNLDTNPSTGELNVGDNIEFDGKNYVVAENGDLVDDKGNVFKEAKDIDEWLKSMNIEDGNSEDTISISSIQEALGVNITDENGNNVEFTNDAAGVKSYVDSVIELRSNEIKEAAINRLYADNPLLKQFQDYVQLTGSPRGFGEIPDRSGIQLDKENEAQLVAVIKMAAREFGNKSLNDNYIKYLRDSGSLYDEAKVQLAALVDKDTAYRKDIEARAQEQRDAEAKSIADYWASVNKMITSRNVRGCKLPETFTKEVNGKKVICTMNDFFKYVSNPIENEDGSRTTQYAKDLANLSNEDYIGRDILDAWLLYTGGTYKDLIDMAVKEEQVRKLRITSKEQRSAKSVRIVKNTNAKKTSVDDIVF